MNVPAKFPSAWRVAVISGAIAVLAPAMTPVFAARPVKKTAAATTTTTKKRTPPQHLGGGGSGLLSLEWTIGAVFQP